VTQANASGETYLSIDGIWKAFGTFLALRDISLKISEGEFVCFLGPSGCGKTTLLRAIAGLDLQTKGKVTQDGKDVSNLPPSERDFGIVFQSYALFPNLTIEKNIAFGLENTGRSKSEITARVAELLDLVGLPEQGKKYPAQLSGGQQQRVAVARAIVSQPDLVLADEPTANLDSVASAQLMELFTRLNQDHHVTFVIATHDKRVMSYARRLIKMQDGRIISDEAQ
jgi:iron(III) transport system ATP-binding protein